MTSVLTRCYEQDWKVFQNRNYIWDLPQQQPKNWRYFHSFLQANSLWPLWKLVLAMTFFSTFFSTSLGNTWILVNALVELHTSNILNYLSLKDPKKFSGNCMNGRNTNQKCCYVFKYWLASSNVVGIICPYPAGWNRVNWTSKIIGGLKST